MSDQLTVIAHLVARPDKIEDTKEFLIVADRAHALGKRAASIIICIRARKTLRTLRSMKIGPIAQRWMSIWKRRISRN